MMAKDKNVTIKKVHLDSLIDILVELYDKGVDYVDIIGVNDKIQDSIGISFSKEYMNTELRENFDNIPTTNKKESNSSDENIKAKINIKLSDDDLNQLL
jgi:hypothetical protein